MQRFGSAVLVSLVVVCFLSAAARAEPGRAGGHGGGNAGAADGSNPGSGGVARPEASGDRANRANRAMDGGVLSVSEPPSPIDREVLALRTRARQVRELIEGRLDPAVDAERLFEPDLDFDREDAIRVEVERLASIVARVDQASEQKTGPSKRANEEVDEGSPDAGAKAARRADPDLFEARVELDRARLAFYRLSPDRRQALLERHEEHQRADRDARAQKGLDEAERKAREAEAEKRRALEAIQRARSEAERWVAEERARLLGVAEEQAAREAELVRSRQRLKERAETTLALGRRVRELIDGSAVERSTVDALYDELRSFLRSSRNELSTSISALTAGSEVPDAGPARLESLSIDADRADLDRTRAQIEQTGERLRGLEIALRQERAAQLYDEVRRLNADRLRLLPHLSPARREAIVGFGVAGLDQATSELRQVTLELAYHVTAIGRWLESLAASRGRTGALFGLVAMKWLFAWITFVWWRRSGAQSLTRWRERLHEERRRARSVEPDWLEQALLFIERIRKPLEWLILVWVLVALLPDPLGDSLEVELLATVLTWTLGSALAVSTIDALAEAKDAEVGVIGNASDLRLRSLRLVSRTVVAFGLILELSARLVGRGTIHSWVFSLCWFSAIPVALVLVRWWREVIFTRIEATRRKKAFEAWVMENRSGWKSFPSAVAAGIFLFLRGAVRGVRAWVGRFDLTRRALAYLFRRGLDRLVEEKGRLSLARLPDATYAALGPEQPSRDMVPGSADEQVEAVFTRISRTGGGVFAVVGERGSGKTTVLGRVSADREEVVLVDCPAAGLSALRSTLVQALSVDTNATLDDCAARLNVPGRDSALLIDSAHRLIRPVMGGLAEFDRLLAIARAQSAHCSWFFAIDEVVWRFFERSRGSRPLFDEVIALESWREEEIANLLRSRSVQAGVEPTFEYLVDELPPDADAIDRREAEERAARGYYRLLWDYSSGNPGVALHMWRRSLGIDAGGRVCVKLFQAPDARELELLPDPAVFVLRAVIQLDPALPADVARATLLRPDQVEDSLRYGLARGYFQVSGSRYRVTWAWFRPITRFLQRRHLLAAPG